MTNSLLKQQKERWEKLAQSGAERSVLDPNDSSGKKNAYMRYTITNILEKVFSGNDLPATLLDFGCGSGGNSVYLSKIGYKIFGVDIAFELLSYTNTLNNGDHLFAQYDGKRLPVKNDSLDGGFTNGVMRCIIDTEMAQHTLGELYRAIKPGGRMVFIEQVERKRRILKSKNEVQRTLSEYYELFSFAGFTVESHRIIRRGHFPLIYCIRYGLIPTVFHPWIASLELWLGKLFPYSLFDYAATAFICRKKEKDSIPAS